MPALPPTEGAGIWGQAGIFPAHLLPLIPVQSHSQLSCCHEERGEQPSLAQSTAAVSLTVNQQCSRSSPLATCPTHSCFSTGLWARGVRGRSVKPCQTRFFSSHCSSGTTPNP